MTRDSASDSSTRNPVHLSAAAFGAVIGWALGATGFVAIVVPQFLGSASVEFLDVTFTAVVPGTQLVVWVGVAVAIVGIAVLATRGLGSSSSPQWLREDAWSKRRSARLGHPVRCTQLGIAGSCTVAGTTRTAG